MNDNPDRNVPPWHYWSMLSTKAEALDTINTDCGHNFYWIPYSIDYLVKSRISLRDNTCHNQFCKAIDDYKFEKDIQKDALWDIL